METSRLLECLTDDFARLREVAAKDLSPAVPSCPGWTVTDLVRHVAEVYLHKVETMRQQKLPDSWPPIELIHEEPLGLLDRGYADLTQEFADRTPEMPSPTWYGPDQTVGFWIRRMAQETVIHRIDAELAQGETVAPIPEDLAIDGIDEVLVIFLGYGSEAWLEEFESDLRAADPRPLLITAGGFAWVLTATPTGVRVAPGGSSDAAATVHGEPAALLRWLWGRGGDGVLIDGDETLVTQLRRLLVMATQ
jgi:uncharacterized protein (TIGR03083 family)